MLLRKKNSIALLCLLLACCQEVDLDTKPSDGNQAATSANGQSANVVGTGQGTMEYPFTVNDIRSLSLSASEAVWVIGYMVGTARTAMSHAEFTSEAGNQSNILLSNDSLCTDTARCIPVELSSDKWKKALSLPTNLVHFRKCLLVKGIPSTYLRRKGLRNVSEGLWLDGFDIASVAPQDWDSIELPF